MTDDYDIDFLVEHRPELDAPSQTDTEYARASLIAHGRRRRQRRRTAAVVQVGALVATVVAVVVVIGDSGSHSHAAAPVAAAATPPRPRTSRHVHASPRTPLLKLASDVRTMPSRPQPGDATLVVRDTIYDGSHTSGGAVYGGYDLYADSGQYYYAPDSLAQLQQTVDEHQTVTGVDEEQALDRLATTAGGSPAQARAAALSMTPYAAGPLPTVAQQHARWSRQPAVIKQRFPFHPYDAASWRESQDADVYITADQALQAGAGRNDVRAGAMKALSTLQGVTQTPTTVDGVKALEVDFPIGGGPEILWLDATTGAPIQEKDGSNSATTYSVERVTAAHLPSSVSPDARLR